MAMREGKERNKRESRHTLFFEGLEGFDLHLLTLQGLHPHSNIASLDGGIRGDQGAFIQVGGSLFGGRLGCLFGGLDSGGLSLGWAGGLLFVGGGSTLLLDGGRGLLLGSRGDRVL
jgi:hypothetical protein